MPNIIAATSQNSEGEMLWCVYFQSSYYDNDPRMPGIVPIDERFYVLAKDADKAISKVRPQIVKARKRCDKGAEEKIDVTIVAIENLVPARDSSDEGRLGFRSTHPLKPVKLSCKKDIIRYRLGVCLIPIK